MGRLPVVVTKLFLALIGLGSLAAQVWFFPTVSEELARLYPEMSAWHWPLLAVVIAGILLVQVGLVAVWNLLTMVEGDRVFSPAAFAWVDALIAVAAIDAALTLGINLFLSFLLHANPPALMLFLLATTVAGGAFACLMLVMKGLLRKATLMQSDLSEVI